MFTLVQSDLIRLGTNWKRWIPVLLMTAGFAFLTYAGMTISGEQTSASFLASFEDLLIIVCCAFGTAELGWLFAAKPKAENHPALIQTELPGWKIVLARFAVYVLLVLTDLAVLACAVFAAAYFCQISLEGFYAAQLMQDLFLILMFILTSALPGMLLFFWTGKTFLMTAGFLLMMMNSLAILVSCASNQLNADLSCLDVQQQISQFGSWISGGRFSLSAGIAVVLYTALLLAACSAVFKRKEPVCGQ